MIKRSYLHGIYFIPLATIKDPELFLPTITHMFGLDDGEDQQLLSRLKEYLSDKHLLLLLDNFEQVLPLAPLFGELLAACPYLKVLMTSREALHLDAEHIFPVLPLEQPEPEEMLDLAAPCAAVRLFIHYAQRSDPDFHLTRANAHAIAEICMRLDGIPLAIELVARRVKYLSLARILKQLEQQLSQPGQSTRDTSSRHSLYDVVRWLYDSLETQERQLFRMLSVFCGGCTVESVEAVWRKVGGEAAALPPLLHSLLEKHFVYKGDQEDGGERFYLLEVLREYAMKRLKMSGEAELVRNAHMEYYIELAEVAKLELKREGQSPWLERLQMEQDNLREAFRWIVEQEEVEGALRLGGALWRFWYTCGYSNEGRRWLERAVYSRPASISTAPSPFEALSLDRQAENFQEAIAAIEQRNVPYKIASQIQQITASSPSLLTVHEKLTQREVEVLRLVSLGYTNDEVAHQLVISSRTVHAHLRSIYSKLGITSRSAATRYAITHQLT
ncbi:MAG TPA: LuxR C-terminal-related transcriptional regulator [Ktedonobacteraceae bacterium]|nr:LuxR C-terminal-related transcriptional regulator [Ktedonobacteraceae bacterium]